MQIDSHPRKVSELFPIEEFADTFIIPEYQRRYSWGNDQIEQLFNDIQAEDEGYYIGNLVTNPEPDDDRKFDVIDGQQRLTTISLFLLALWDKFNDFVDRFSAPAIPGTVHDDDPSQPPVSPKDFGMCYSNCSDIVRRLLSDPENATSARIVPLEEDRGYYYGLLSRLTDSPTPVAGNRVFVKRYHHIRAMFDDTTSFPDVKSLDRFYRKLLSTIVLQISVAKLSDAFSIFSSLNAKGLPLTLVDLLKGKFIGEATRKGIDRHTTLEEWDAFVGTFSAKDEDANIPIVTQFLLNNFDVFESSGTQSITKGKALSQYETVIQDQYRSGNNYLEMLLSRAKVFSEITRVPGHEYGETGIDRKLRVLKNLDSTQAIPLMLSLFVNREKFGLDNSQLNTILDILICFYVRRNVTLVPKSSNTRSKMIGLVRTITNERLKGEAIIMLISTELKNISSSDSIFIEALETEGLYDKNAKTTRCILIELERKLPGSSPFDKGHPDNLDGCAANGKPIWTIEHILPEGENLPEYWQNAISPSDPSKAGEVQEQYVHLLGNLTLTPYNSDLKQHPFVNDEDPYKTGMTSYRESKRDFCDNGHFVGMRNPIRLNASIPDTAHGETIEDKSEWTLSDITRRTKYLAGEVVRIFSFPKVRA